MDAKTQRYVGAGVALLVAVGAGYALLVSNTSVPPVTTVLKDSAANRRADLQQETTPSAVTHAELAELESKLRGEFEYRDRARDEPNEFEALKQELDELRSELVRLGRENTALALQLREQTGSADHLAEIETSDEETIPAAVEEQAEAEMLAQLDALEFTVQTEPLDSEWAPQAHVELTNAFVGEELKGIELLAADCRSTLCRIEIGLDDLEAGQESLRKLSLLTPWPSEGFIRYDGGDSRQAVVYLSREGHTLHSKITAE